MQQYYTLEQAAQILRVSPEDLKEMARKKEIRAFQDRSGWRFRSQEIDELARAKGYGSDPELPLGEAAKAKAGDSGAKDVFNFSLESDESDEVPLGREPTSAEKHPSRSPTPKSGGSKSGSKSPPPKASSDSDVRLVMDSGDMDLASEGGSKAPPSKGPVSPPPKKPGSSKSRMHPPVKDDSAVRIVPLDKPSDSEIKVPKAPAAHDSDVPVPQPPAKRPSDSDIRIEEITRPPAADQMVTEEIDLDAERRKAESAARKATKSKSKPKPQGGAPVLPTSSPFELSEADINMDGPTIPPAAPRAPEEAAGETDSSSDFELKPMGDSSPLDAGSDELPVLMGDDEVNLGELTGAKGGSGINLQDPADSGISLEGSDEMEFELSLDAGNTPKPAPPAKGTPESSSEFELSLSEEDASPTDGASSSEFELSLDPEGSDLAVDEGSSDLALESSSGSDSDSEFELTLDESGGLSVEEGSSSSEQDIFETDFEVPSLGEESGSEAVALEESDTDLESSEFDLSVEGEESGSQVVPLEDEEEYDEGAATVQRPAVGGAVEDEEDIGEALDEDLDQAAVAEEEAEPVAAAAAPPAEWGAMPAIVLIPCTLILFVVGLMSFEMIQGMWGYHKGSRVSNLVIHPIAKMFDEKLPED
jgi:excisionase family DNA binding protein